MAMHDAGQMRIHRFIAIGMLFLLILAIFVARLVKMQLTDYDGSYSFDRLAAAEDTVPVKAIRGNICDRNGKVLVSSEEQYTMVANANLPKENEACNRILSTLLTVMDSCKVACDGTATMMPYTFDGTGVTLGVMSGDAQAWYAQMQKDQKWAATTDGNTLFEQLCSFYAISEGDAKQRYRLAQLRYDLDAYREKEKIYCFHKNCDISLVTAVTERALDGIGFSTDMVRIYHYPGYMSQILGRTGKIQSGDVDYFTELGYAMDAVVGVDGIEKQYETTLCGTDGSVKVTLDAAGNVLKSVPVKQAKAGQNVYLTIDIDLQIKAEQALAANIAAIAATGQGTADLYDGEDAAAGALVLVNPNDGAVLAMASCPTFNLVTYSSDYATLSKDENRPYLNRTLQGLYAPGSTFKPGVAAAALENGIIAGDTVIRDQGIYKYFTDFQPRCWIYTRNNGATHGDENVVGAIRDSCNYFFYETGRLLGIEKMNTYMSALGFGQSTGIELNEKTGTLAGPAERKAKGERWNPGDVLQAAIGQSDNLFTPLQMAMYLSTVVNGGTRYQAHLYAKTTEFSTEKTLDTYAPTVLDRVQLQPYHLALIRQAMAEVTTTGSGRYVFGGTAYSVGCKTGTAQVSTTASDNALFEAFAPLENPQIVAFAVVENGSSGTSAGQCVRDVFDAYFSNGQGG